jgi:hypothetical protein
MIRTVRIWLACRRLNKLVERNRKSFEIESYRRRRSAAHKATRAA